MMKKINLEALAYDEASRLLETDFSYYNPYTRVIECVDIPFDQREKFCQMVEDELKAKGEDIVRDGFFFKICRYQKDSHHV